MAARLATGRKGVMKQKESLDLQGALGLPVTRSLFWLCAVLMLVWVAGIDRTFMRDQDAYLDYFAEALRGGWSEDLFAPGRGIFALVVSVFSDELVWRLWTVLLSLSFEPAPAVFATVLALNLLIVLACARLANPLIALTLWALLPVGLAVIGVMQIRQGLGLAVMLFACLGLRRPVLGTLVAASVHTTFVVAFVFVAIWATMRNRARLALAFCAAAGVGGAVLGAVIFDMFGGRRLEDYSVSEGASSLNFVIAALVCALPSVERVLFAPATALDSGGRMLDAIAVTHVGITAFVCSAFFVFPIGTGRIGYMSLLLLIPMLGATRLSRPTELAAVLVASISVAYLIARAWTDGIFLTLL
jgi:hypothetical protein